MAWRSHSDAWDVHTTRGQKSAHVIASVQLHNSTRRTLKLQGGAASLLLLACMGGDQRKGCMRRASAPKGEWTIARIPLEQEGARLPFVHPGALCLLCSLVKRVPPFGFFTGLHPLPLHSTHFRGRSKHTTPPVRGHQLPAALPLFAWALPSPLQPSHADFPGPDCAPPAALRSSRPR